MAGDCGLNALSLLPENVLPQWQVLDLNIFLQIQPGH
jgi:hypothetical protein